MEEEFVQIKSDLPCTYNFIYKNKKYPIILDLFIDNSKYFLQNKEEIMNIKDIQIIDEKLEGNINFSEKIIDTFI